jgi:hypothetical protein
VAPAPIFCPEKQSLLNQFNRVTAEYLRIQAVILKATIDGHGSRLQDELERVRTHMLNAKEAVLLHQREHGCGRDRS